MENTTTEMKTAEIAEGADCETNTDSSRMLASVQLVDSVTKHSNANDLVIANVLGWQIVARPDEVTATQTRLCQQTGGNGTLIIYCEIDSMLPGDAEWLPEAVKQRVAAQENKKHYRLQTIRLRGEYSQGLIIPLHPSMFTSEFTLESLHLGQDVTKQLGIKKYERPSYTGGNGGGTGEPRVSNFPTHLIDKTDEHRIQSSPKLADGLEEVVVTVKQDGMSGSYLIDPETGELMVLSRNMIRPKPAVPATAAASDCPYWYLAEKYKISEKLMNFPDFAIQGEVCGPGIQKNLLGLKDKELFVFNVIDIKHRQRLNHYDALDFCQKLDLQFVPVVGVIKNLQDAFKESKFPKMIDFLLEMSKGKYPGTKNDREGLVIRSTNGKVSFKVINNLYLLKNE